MNNPMLSPVFCIWSHRQLIVVLAKRELAQRFMGSYLGRFWLILSPFLMLAIYAYFFGEILQAKWSLTSTGGGLTNFALMIFSGLILHQFFSDSITRAPDLVLSNPNYVKKIIFPTEILPVVALLVTFVQLMIGLAVLVSVFGITTGKVFWTWLLIPLIYLPFTLFTLGASWVLASLGLFLRDIRQVMQFSAAALLFLSPVFYPMDRLPIEMQFLKYVNPLIIAIEQSRIVLFTGISPNWSVLAIYTFVSVIVAISGFYFFIRSKPAFADVI